MRLLTFIVSGILFFSVVDFSWAQKSTLEKIHQERMIYDSLQGKKILAYLHTNTSSPLRSLTCDSSFLLTEITTNGFPIYKAALNTGAALTTGVTTLQNESLGLNLQGEGITVGVWDDGLVKDHIELGNRILTKEGSSYQTHATHVTGTILATGMNAAAKGMAPKATGTTWYFDNDEAEMAALAKTDQTGLLFSNHSYGIVTGWTKVNGAWVWTGDVAISTKEDYRHGFYGTDAQLIDQIAFNAPYYAMAWAAGNDRIEVGDGSYPPDGNEGTGYDCIIPQAVAKNIITVGAVNKVSSYSNPSSVVMTNFSSWGPTDDGRIKPDLVGAGVNVFSLSAGGTNQYATLSGTSMATPNVTGSLVLVQELYNKLHGGNYMKAATLKGLAIHTAKETGSFPGPDYNFGWGLLDVQSAANVLLHEDEKNIFIQEERLENGQTYSMDILPQANQKVTVTICWTDPEGTPVAASLDPTNLMLVNDLDVRIVDELGNEQLPWILNPGSPSSKATTGDNFRDNVEKIEFSNPSAKKYTVKVKHKGSLVNNAQDFSIIITLKSTLNSSLTYYWIGNSGNWNDSAHWSLTTGGTSVNAIPTANDNVIFDDNSFDGILLRSVTLTSDVTCNKMMVLTDRLGQLILNSHQLSFSNDLLMSAADFKITSDGILNFKSLGKHSANIQKGNLSKTSLEFNGGHWLVSGNLNAQKISVKKDTLSLQPFHYSIKEFNAQTGTTLDIHESIIDSLEQSTIAPIRMSSSDATITIFENAVLNWDINYEGILRIKHGVNVLMNKTDTLQSLQLESDSEFRIANNTIQHVSDLTLQGLTEAECRLISDEKATLDLLSHNKFCFDYLNVTNVDVTGNSVVNAGLNSSVSNSANWIQQECDQILYPDFETKFNCQNGFTSFVDKSEGSVTSWSWNFGDNQSRTNTSAKQNAFHSFSDAGTFKVTLTVSDGSISRSYTKDVLIESNSVNENTIVSNGTSLLSFLQADNYQWYKNDEPIDGAISRSYNYAGDLGSFVVVISTSSCNVASTPFLVTEIENINNELQILPNPANDFIKISGARSRAYISISDALGREMLHSNSFENETVLDIRYLNEGLYILKIEMSGSQIQRKILINR
ncbi:MAG TPA: S8 family serine peptidase [Cyclobacteriaceae bacterium]